MCTQGEMASEHEDRDWDNVCTQQEHLRFSSKPLGVKREAWKERISFKFADVERQFGVVELGRLSNDVVGQVFFHLGVMESGFPHIAHI